MMTSQLLDSNAPSRTGRAGPTRHRLVSALQRVGAAAAALVTLGGLAVGGLAVTTAQAEDAVPAGRTGTPGPRVSLAPRAAVVAVVLGSSATIGSDALGPYEVFASSASFTTYTIAADSTPARTEGGPSIVPTVTFADAAAGRAPLPDVVVVPGLQDPYGPTESATRAWIAAQAQRGARILGVCTGSLVLAAGGVLDGHTATSHWSRLSALRSRHPGVHWVDGQRFVMDGRITTTGGVTSGIPAALRVVADVAGPAEAARVGQLVDYPGWSGTGTATIPVASFAFSDLPLLLNALIPWQRPVLGLAVPNGVGEIDLASAFEVFDTSYAARAVPISPNGTATTRHGLTVVTATPQDFSHVQRLAVVGRAGATALDPRLHTWAATHHVPIDEIHAPAAGYDGALKYLSQRAGLATAVSTAKMVEYPTDRLRLSDASPSPRVNVLLGVGLLFAAAAANLPPLITRLVRQTRRRDRAPDPKPGRSAGAKPPQTFDADSTSQPTTTRSLR